MNEEKDEIKKKAEATDSEPQNQSADEAGKAEAPEKPEKAEKPDKHAKKAAKELEELNEKYLRLYAEYENYRRRSEKEKGESYQAGITHAVTSFLPLLDNVERALSYEPENQGVKILIKQLNEIFEKLGIEEIESDGKEFDPNLHNAVMHDEDPEQGENLVSQTFQKGYSLNGKVVRHAVVKVVN